MVSLKKASSQKKLYIAIVAIFILSFLLGSLFYKNNSALNSEDSYTFIKRKFHSDFRKAFDEAKEKNQLVLAFFHAPWCPYSGASIENSFSKKVIKDFLDDFVFLQVDLESVEYIKIKEKYDISGTNRVLFLNSRSEKVAQVYGSSLADNDFAILRFFKNLDGSSGLVTSSMVKDRIILDAIVDLLIFSSSQFQEKNWVFAGQLISSFSQRFPDISVEKLEHDLLFKKAQKEGKLYMYRDLILNVNKEPNWIIALLNDEKMNEDSQKVDIARNTRSSIRVKIQKEKKKRNPDLRDFYKNLLSLNDIIGESDDKLWSEFLDFVNDNGNRRSDQVYISQALTWRGHYDDSIKQYDKLLKMTPNSISLKIRKAKVFIKAKRYAEAISLLKSVKSNTFGENKLKSFLFLSQAHRGLGNSLEADDWLRQGKVKATEMYGEHINNSKWYKRILEEEKK